MLEFNNFAPDFLALINNSLFEHFIFRYKRIILQKPILLGIFLKLAIIIIIAFPDFKGNDFWKANGLQIFVT